MSFTQVQNDIEEAKTRLTKNPCDLRALAILVYNTRRELNAGYDPAQQNFDSVNEYSLKGLECVNESVSPQDRDSEMIRKLLIVFNGGAGFAALQRKEFDHAQSYLRAAVNGDPSDLQNVYPLAIAYLQATPPNSVEGLFFLARAIVLTEHNKTPRDQLQKYAIRVYRNYHGVLEGWDRVLSTAKKNGVPPADFTITKSNWSHPVAIDGTEIKEQN